MDYGETNFTINLQVNATKTAFFNEKVWLLAFFEFRVECSAISILNSFSMLFSPKNILNASLKLKER